MPKLLSCLKEYGPQSWMLRQNCMISRNQLARSWQEKEVADEIISVAVKPSPKEPSLLPDLHSMIRQRKLFFSQILLLHPHIIYTPIYQDGRKPAGTVGETADHAPEPSQSWRRWRRRWFSLWRRCSLGRRSDRHCCVGSWRICAFSFIVQR